MIYDYPGKTQIIQQGDIFYYLPLIQFQLDQIAVKNPDGTEDFTSALDKIQNKQTINANVFMEPTIGIVANQDCDNLRNDFITFFQIEPFSNVAKNLPKKKSSDDSLKKYYRYILDGYISDGYRWLYLPMDDKIGFTENMAINFDLAFHIERESLNKMITLRKGRLKPETLDLFRHTISNYFTRYAYRRTQVLNEEELEEYKRLFPEDDLK